MIIKKYVTGTGWVAQSPKVSYTDVVVNFGLAEEVTAFPNGKLRESLLPDSVFSGMTFVGTLSISGSPSSPFELKRLITGTATSGYSVSTNLDTFTGNDYSLDEYAGIGQRYIGHYFIVTSSQVGVFDSTNGTPEASWDTAVFDEGVAPASVGGGLFPDNINLEIGDWLIITGWDNTNKTFLFRTISNNLRAATDTESGTVKLGSSTVQSTAANAVTATTGRTYAIQKLTGTDQLVVNVPWSDTNTEYSEATSSTLGLVKIGYTQIGNNYPVELALGKMYVNVPWTDTTYSAGVGISLSGTEFKMTQPIRIGTATPASTYNVADALWFDTN